MLPWKEDVALHFVEFRSNETKRKSSPLIFTQSFPKNSLGETSGIAWKASAPRLHQSGHVRITYHVSAFYN